MVGPAGAAFGFGVAQALLLALPVAWLPVAWPAKRAVSSAGLSGQMLLVEAAGASVPWRKA